MAFSDDDKERVRAATSIIDLIGAVTPIKRAGRSHVAICPFHEEKTPSMSVDPGRGLYHCFGCGAGGDVFNFAMETMGLDFTEAVEVLAQRAGITLTEDPGATRRRDERRRLVDVNRQALAFFHRRLISSPDGGHARAYLRSRGYDAEVVDEFELGYAPEGSTALVSELRAAGVPDAVMVEAGVARRGGGLDDYFRDRLIFPIRDIRGDVVGFAGRNLGGDGPKYLNTAETSLYHKARVLYGLDRARSHIGRLGYAVVVEGYTDVIALHQAGLPVGVATCGTALGEGHFDLLRRFTDRVILAFDADAAGAGAALRGETLETPVRLDLDLRVAEMPAGADPADLIQRGEIPRLRQALDRALPLLQFWLEREFSRHDIYEPEGRARALSVVAPRIAKVADPRLRTEYARLVGERLGMRLEVVERAIGGTVPQPAELVTVQRAPWRAGLEEKLLRSVLADGGAAQVAGVEANMFGDPDLREAFERVSSSLAGAVAGRPLPLPTTEDAIGLRLMRLAMDQIPVDPVGDLVTRIRKVAVEGEIARLRDRVRQLPTDQQTGSPEMQELIRLQRVRRELEAAG